MVNSARIFNTTSKNQTVENIREMLKREQSYGKVEITRDDTIEIGEDTIEILEAKIVKGERGLYFTGYMNGFILQAKKLSLSHNMLKLDKQAVDFDCIVFDNKDTFNNFSLGVEYL